MLVALGDTKAVAGSRWMSAPSLDDDDRLNRLYTRSFAAFKTTKRPATVREEAIAATLGETLKMDPTEMTLP